MRTLLFRRKLACTARDARTNEVRRVGQDRFDAVWEGLQEGRWKAYSRAARSGSRDGPLPGNAFSGPGPETNLPP